MDPRPLAPDEETKGLVDDFLAAQLRPRTRSTYETDVAVFFGWLGRRSVHPLAVGRRDIDRYRNWMSELVDADGKPTLHGQPRFAPATVAKRLSAVRSFYGYVVDRGTIDASPAVGVKVPRTPREPRGHAITENQVAKLIAAAQDHSDTSEAIVRLLVTNGLRVSEVCAALVELLEREPDGAPATATTLLASPRLCRADGRDPHIHDDVETAPRAPAERAAGFHNHRSIIHIM